MKKVILAVIAGLMLTVIFAGCAKLTPAETETPAETVTPPAAETPAQ